MTDIHQSIADSMPELSHLECGMCGETQDLGEVSEHLKNGWPRHCGFTMSLITKNQMSEKEAK